MPALSLNLSASLLNVASIDGHEKSVLAIKILPDAIDMSSRSAKHLALLLDVSGSMEGERITAVKRTIHLLIDALPIGDKLTIISYASESSITVETVLGDDRSDIHRSIDNLHADGGTNLENAVLILKDLMTRGPVDSAFILTDGHINEGLSSSVGLLRILGSGGRLPPLNTLGFGTDYNIRTLKKLSIATRGSHTFADVAELLPVIIGDIVGGLASEVARIGNVRIPPGWRCLEIGCEDSDETYNVGSILAEKEQWVLLAGPRNNAPSTIEFSCENEHGNSMSWTIRVDSSIPEVEICEQLDRTRVTSVFGHVTELLETRRIDQAKLALDALSLYLQQSMAKDRPFAIRLQAQVDEMREEISRPHYNVGVAPRMASNQVALGVQRGIVSRIQSAQPQNDEVQPRAITGVYDTFSSPIQRLASSTMSQNYSRYADDPSEN